MGRVFGERFAARRYERTEVTAPNHHATIATANRPAPLKQWQGLRVAGFTVTRSECGDFQVLDDLSRNPQADHFTQDGGMSFGSVLKQTQHGPMSKCFLGSHYRGIQFMVGLSSM